MLFIVTQSAEPLTLKQLIPHIDNALSAFAIVLISLYASAMALSIAKFLLKSYLGD